MKNIFTLLVAILVSTGALAAGTNTVTPYWQGGTGSATGNLSSLNVTPLGSTNGTMANITGQTDYFNAGPYLTYDNVTLLDGSVTSTTLTSASASFTQAIVGKPIVIYTTGTSNFRGTISAVTNATTLTLSGTLSTGTCSGACSFSYGTDNSTALTSAITAAQATQPLVYNPWHKVNVLIPYGATGYGIGLAAAVSVPNGITLTAKPPVTNLAASTATNVLQFAQSGIGDFNYFNAAAGQGFKLTGTGDQKDFHIGNIGIYNVGFTGQTAFDCGTSKWTLYFDGQVNVMNGSNSYTMGSCSDVHIAGIAVATGANKGLSLNGAADVQGHFSFDTIGTYAFLGDALRNIKLDIDTFNNNSNTNWTAGIVLGSLSTTPSTGVSITGIMEKAQGSSVPMINMDYMESSSIKLLQSDAGSGTTFGSVLTYGTHNTGTNYVEAILKSPLTVFGSGTQDTHVHVTTILGNAKAEYGPVSVTGGFTTDTSVASSTSSATSFIPTGSTVPSNGLYIPAANTPAIAALGAPVLKFTNVASPDNYVSINAQAQFGAPGFSVISNESDNWLELDGKGTRGMSSKITSSSATSNNLRLVNADTTVGNADGIEFHNSSFTAMSKILTLNTVSNNASGSGTMALQTASSGVLATGILIGANQAVSMPALASSSAAQTGTVCWSTGGGNLTVDTTTTCLLSARRFKEEITPLEGGLSEIMSLKPVSYFYKDRSFIPDRQVGLIAEDVAGVDKRLVSYEKDGQLHSVRYENLTSVLTLAIQEQQAEITDLKAAISDIKSSNTAHRCVSWLPLMCN